MTPKFQIRVLDVEAAPAAARNMLKAAHDKFGFVPNLLGVMANAPALLEGYLALSTIFDKTSLSPTERQIILLATSYDNGCDYCMAAHTAIAGMQHVDQGVIQAMRENTPIGDAKMEALRSFARETSRSRGWPSAKAVSAFTAAGYSPTNALEVVLGVGMKTLSNYTNHFAETPLDKSFAPLKWAVPTADPTTCGCTR